MELDLTEAKIRTSTEYLPSAKIYPKSARRRNELITCEGMIRIWDLNTEHRPYFTVNRDHKSNCNRDSIDRWALIYTFYDIFRYDIRDLIQVTNVHHDSDW